MYKNKTLHQNKGFTLVEIIVTTVVITLMLPIISLVLFGVVRQQIAVTRLSEVKRQGDLALDAIKTKTIREVSSMYQYDEFSGTETEVCTTVSSAEDVTYFKDITGKKVEYFITNGVLKYRYNDGAPIDVTTNKVTIEDLNMQCIKSASYSNPLVSVSFEVGYNGAPSAIDVNPSLTYSTKVIILN